MKKVKVTVPASTTNLGCGFDCLGLALSLYNSIEIEKIKEEKVIVEVKGEGEGVIPLNDKNIIFPALKMVFEKAGEKVEGIKIKEENNIPLERGLGSSAATRIGAIVAACNLLDLNLSRKEILKMASSLEGHPDNAAASLLGGFVAVADDEKGPYWVRLSVPENLRVCVILPEVKIPTEKAREALPEKVPLKDAIFNLSRVSILIPSLVQGRWENLAFATQDKIHQPYRSKLLPQMRKVFEAALSQGAKGVFLSGAGSGIAAFCLEEEAEKIGEAMKKVFLEEGIKSYFLILSIDNKGCRVNEKR